MSTLFVNNLNTASGSTITVPTGKTIVVTDEGGLRVPGSVIQVVEDKNAQNVVVNGTTFGATNLQANITPKYSNSKILVVAVGGFDTNTAGRGCRGTIFRTVSGASAVNIADENGGQEGFAYAYSTARLQVPCVLQVLDSPSTTSSTNYRVYIQASGSGNVEFPGHYQDKRIVLYEIAQ